MDDPLAPARGIMLGVMLGGIGWAIIGAAAYGIWRWLG